MEKARFWGIPYNDNNEGSPLTINNELILAPHNSLQKLLNNQRIRGRDISDFLQKSWCSKIKLSAAGVSHT